MQSRPLFLLLSFVFAAGSTYAQGPAKTTIVRTPAECTWVQVGLKWQVSPALLYAIAKTESSLNPDIVHRNNDGTEDIGLMQINSSWLPKLASFGISRRHLFDSCVNLDVAGWILSTQMGKLGNTWEAVGSYNAVTPWKRMKYASQVYANLPKAVLDTHR